MIRILLPSCGRYVVSASVVWLVASAAGPTAAEGQACLGSPMGPNQFGVAASTTFGNGFNTVGLTLGHDFDPVALHGFVDVESGRAWPVGLQLAYDFAGRSSSCVVAGVEYRAWQEEREGDSPRQNHRFAFPLGVAGGRIFSSQGGLSYIPFINVGLVYNSERERQYWHVSSRVGATAFASRFFGSISVTYSSPMVARVAVGITI